MSLQGAHRAEIGYLAQEPRFYGWMTGRQTLAYVSSFYRDAGARRIDELLDLVGLTDAADRPTKTYSGGMRQRLGIAQAMAGDASVLLLDEPAAALDPLGRHDVLELMQQLRGEKTIFYSTHILDDVWLGATVAILDKGKLVVSASTAGLMNEFTVGCIRVVVLGGSDATRVALETLPGVTQVYDISRDGDEWQYDVSTADGQTVAVQGAVTRWAAEAGLTLTAKRPQSMDLEEVFLRIVNEERAA